MWFPCLPGQATGLHTRDVEDGDQGPTVFRLPRSQTAPATGGNGGGNTGGTSGGTTVGTGGVNTGGTDGGATGSTSEPAAVAGGSGALAGAGS